MGKFKHRLAAVAAIALTVGSGFIAPQPALASAILCTPNEKWFDISESMSYQLTHVSGYHLGPGAAYTHSKTAEFVRQLSSSASVSAGAKISASDVVASAEVSLDVNLASAGSETTKSDETVTVEIAKSDKDRYFAAYSARRVYTGTYKYQQCAANGLTIKTLYSGTWGSYSVATVSSESALCTIGTTERTSAYSSGTAPYKACKATWW